MPVLSVPNRGRGSKKLVLTRLQLIRSCTVAGRYGNVGTVTAHEIYIFNFYYRVSMVVLQRLHLQELVLGDGEHGRVDHEPLHDLVAGWRRQRARVAIVSEDLGGQDVLKLHGLGFAALVVLLDVLDLVDDWGQVFVVLLRQLEREQNSFS